MGPISLLAFLSASFSAAQAPLVVAIGDSTTAGTPYFLSPSEAPPGGRGDAEAPYPREIERRLGWSVLNRGVAGERSDEIRARFMRDALSEHPRYVILLAGVNDIYQGVPLSETEKNLRWMYERARESRALPIAASVLPFDRSTAAQRARLRELNDWIRKEAAAEKIPFCDFAAAAADGRDRDKLSGSPDGLHPNRATYALVGAAAARCLKTLEKPRAAEKNQLR